MPFHPTNSVKALKGKYHTPYGLAYPKLTWGLPTLSLTTISPSYLGGGLPSDASTFGTCLGTRRGLGRKNPGHGHAELAILAD